jgi:hypothetical protein
MGFLGRKLGKKLRELSPFRDMNCVPALTLAIAEANGRARFS